jgi:hypothetical protein
MDIDQSGSLDRDEFLQVMMVLCSNVLTRVMVQCENRYIFDCCCDVITIIVISHPHSLTHPSLSNREHDAHYCATRGTVHSRRAVLHQ